MGAYMKPANTVFYLRKATYTDAFEDELKEEFIQSALSNSIGAYMAYVNKRHRARSCGAPSMISFRLQFYLWTSGLTPLNIYNEDDFKKMPKIGIAMPRTENIDGDRPLSMLLCMPVPESIIRYVATPATSTACSRP